MLTENRINNGFKWHYSGATVQNRDSCLTQSEDTHQVKTFFFLHLKKAKKVKKSSYSQLLYIEIFDNLKYFSRYK